MLILNHSHMHKHTHKNRHTHTCIQVSACFGIIAMTWRYMAQYTWLHMARMQDCVGVSVCLYINVYVCLCVGLPLPPPIRVCCFHAYWSQHVLFRYHPPPNFTAVANLSLMTTSHTPTCPHSQTRVHSTGFLSIQSGCVIRMRSCTTRLQSPAQLPQINNQCECRASASVNHPSDTCELCMNTLHEHPPQHFKCTHTPTHHTQTYKCESKWHGESWLNPLELFSSFFLVGYMMC